MVVAAARSPLLLLSPPVLPLLTKNKKEAVFPLFICLFFLPSPLVHVAMDDFFIFFFWCFRVHLVHHAVLFHLAFHLHDVREHLVQLVALVAEAAASSSSCTGYSMIKQSRMNERVTRGQLRTQLCTGYSMIKQSRMNERVR